MTSNTPARSTKKAATKATTAKTTPARKAPAKRATAVSGKAPAKAPAKKAAEQAPAEKAAPAKRVAKAVSYPAPVTLSGQEHPAMTWQRLLTEQGLACAEAEKAMKVKIGSVYRVVRHGGIPSAGLTIRFAEAVEADAHSLWVQVTEFVWAEAQAEAAKDEAPAAKKAPAKKAPAKGTSPARKVTRRVTTKPVTRSRKA